MELFSLGIGHFTEEDVRESARAFTGWQLRRKTEFLFNSRQHDFGVKRFLGQSGSFDGDDIVDIIMSQPAAAEYICTRLWSFLLTRTLSRPWSPGLPIFSDRTIRRYARLCGGYSSPKSFTQTVQ